MKLFILFGQRICRYAGEYAVEALEIMDEYGAEENPEFLSEKSKEHRNTREFSALEIIEIEVPYKQIADRLNKPLQLIGELK